MTTSIFIFTICLIYSSYTLNKNGLDNLSTFDFIIIVITIIMLIEVALSFLLTYLLYSIGI